MGTFGEEEAECQYPLARVKRDFVPYRRGAEVAKLVSNTLNSVLLTSGYDKQVRPEVSAVRCVP